MRVITDAPGQTCNRFWSYVDSIGWAIEHNDKVKILYWDKSIKDYPLLRNDKYVSFPLYCTLGIRIFGYDRWNYWVHRLFPNNKFASWFAYRCNWAKRNGFIMGWDTRKETQYLIKNKQSIVGLFEPSTYIRNAAEENILAWKKDGYFVIGIHIRRGDYVDFLNGKYYFTDDEIVGFMAQIESLYSDRKVAFYLASNEKIEKTHFDGFTIIPPSQYSAAYDLKVLSICDRIVGPISTFSRWASFVGNVPLCFLRKGLSIKNDDQFSPIHDYYHFENGKEILSVFAIEQRYKKLYKVK